LPVEQRIDLAHLLVAERPNAIARAFSSAWATVLKPGIGMVTALRDHSHASAP